GLLVGQAPADLDLGQRLFGPGEELFVLHLTSLPRSLGQERGGQALVRTIRGFGPTLWGGTLQELRGRREREVAGLDLPEVLGQYRERDGAVGPAPGRGGSHQGSARAVPRRVEHHAPAALGLSKLGRDQVGPAFG